MLACVVNVSEGRDPAVVADLAKRCGPALLDVHVDRWHNRSVFTLGGDGLEDFARELASAAVERLDLSRHEGVHPRLGVVDVVPFVAVGPGSFSATAPLEEAIAARDRFAAWAGAALSLPCFVYGPLRSLPEVRREAFVGITPDTGPAEPHPSAGACSVGARRWLLAWNVWLERDDLALARRIAAQLRGPERRTLGLAVGGAVQVSCNLVAPWSTGPLETLEALERLAPVRRCELVGLAPQALLDKTPARRWAELDLAEDRTFEARLAGAGAPARRPAPTAG